MRCGSSCVIVIDQRYTEKRANNDKWWRWRVSSSNYFHFWVFTFIFCYIHSNLVHRICSWRHHKLFSNLIYLIQDLRIIGRIKHKKITLNELSLSKIEFEFISEIFHSLRISLICLYANELFTCGISYFHVKRIGSIKHMWKSVSILLISLV